MSKDLTTRLQESSMLATTGAVLGLFVVLAAIIIRRRG